MDIGFVFGGITIACAAAAGFLAVSAFQEKLRVARLRAAAIGSVQSNGSAVSGISALWEYGIAGLTRVSDKLLCVEVVAAKTQDAVLVLFRKGIATSPRSLLSVVLLLAGIVFAAIWVGSGSLIAAVAVVLAAGVAAGLWVRMQKDALSAEIREEIPAVVQSIEACFLTGMTLQQTFDQVASESRGYLQALMQRCSHVLQTGGSAHEALEVLRAEGALPELSFLAMALDVQHYSGGSMREVLEAVKQAVNNKLDLARSLRVQTAQAKLSAGVVSLLPFVLLAVFSLMSPNFLEPFFSSSTGIAVFVLACGMQVLGIAMVRKMLRVEL